VLEVVVLGTGAVGIAAGEVGAVFHHTATPKVLLFSRGQLL